MPRLNPYEQFTFRNLATALAGNLDPAFAQSVYSSTLQTAQQRAMQQQQVLLGLQQMAYQQAAAGMPEDATADIIGAMSGAYPFLNGQNPYSMRQQGVLDDTVSALYPDPTVAPNPLLQAGATPSELRGMTPEQVPEAGGTVPLGGLIRGISNFLPESMPGSKVGELEAFAPNIIGPILDNLRAGMPTGQGPDIQEQLGALAGSQPVQGADGLSPLYTVPRDQQMADAAAQAALQNQSALDLAAGQGQIELGLQAQGLPLEIQRAQALADVDLNSQLNSTVAQAQLQQDLPGMLGPQPLSEEERSSIGQLVQQRTAQGTSLADIRKELMGLTLGMDQSRATEAEQFAIQAWSQLTGSTQSENTRITQLLTQAVDGNVELARRLAGIIVSNPTLRAKFPELLQVMGTAKMQTIGWILNQGQQQQPAAAQTGPYG